jgi:hypothetical protein
MTDINSAAARSGVRFAGEQGYIPSDYSEGDYSLRELRDAGGKITKVRILIEQGRGDISYVQGTLPDGRYVPISLNGCNSIGFRTGNGGIRTMLIEWAKAEGVFGKSINLLDAGVLSLLW